MKPTFLPVLALLVVACNTPAPSGTGSTPANTTAPSSQPATADAGHGAHGDHADAAAFAPLEGASVSFTMPADGDTVTSPVKVAFAVTGAEVKPAGELVKGTGHHHVIVDGQPVTAGEVVPKDDTHIHYGGGQTEAEIELAPGSHTLTLQFADGMHRSYGKDLTSTITVTVEGAPE